jgi:hypothetical protein
MYHLSVLKVVGLLLLSLMISFTATSQQTGGQTAMSIRIDPPKATVYIGETQTFTALNDDAKSGAVKWSIREEQGGHITDEGEYTAPREIGIYHVVASSKTEPRAKAVATVTVVQLSDPPSDSK